MDMDEYDIIYCLCCNDALCEPYIKCGVCMNVLLCLSCFSKGKEAGSHFNDHSYEIIRYNFPLFNQNWTAGENIKLLNSIAEVGLGNWSDVAREVTTKSSEECKAHYFNKYIEGPDNHFPKLPDNSAQYIQPCPIPYKASDDPPRPAIHGDSGKDLVTVGYMPARGDFAIDYDNHAELDICDIELPSFEDDLDEKLKFVILEMYQIRLKERVRRHRIIRNHGLINMSKQFTSWYQYEHTLGRSNIQKMARFTQLFDFAVDYETYVEGLHVEKELIQKIQMLKEARKQGIKRLHSLKLYTHLKKNRMESKPRKNFLDSVLQHMETPNSETWIQQWNGKNATAIREAPTKRKSHPLNIVGLPQYEKLNEKERELCTVARLTPVAFLEFQSILLNHYHEKGSLKLAQARTLIKIDVNKTRKIYDHLITTGSIQNSS